MQSTMNRTLISNSDAKSAKKRFVAENDMAQMADNKTNHTNTSTHVHLNQNA